MNIPADDKLAFISDVLATYAQNFDIVQMREHAALIRNGLAVAHTEPQAVA